MAGDLSHIPITTQEAVAAVRGGAWLFRAHITNLRDVLEALDRDCPGRTLAMVACAIEASDCRGLEIKTEIDLVALGRSGGDYDSVFRGDLNLSQTTFTRAVALRGSFTGAVCLEGARFMERVSFSDAHFAGRVDFHDVHFSHEAQFVLTIFEREARFTRTLFIRTAQFSGATFHREADFSSAVFKEPAVFLASRFNRAIFYGASFGGMTQFVGALVRDSLILEFAQIGSTLDLHVDGQRHVARGRGWLNLANTDLAAGGRILLPMELIGRKQWPVWWSRPMPGAPLLPRPLHRLLIRFQRLLQNRFPNACLLEGEDANDPVRLRSAAAQYNMLRDNFRSMPSMEEEEDRCHYKFKNLTRRSTRGQWLWKLWDWAIMKWCLGYGIYTHRILLTGLGVILGFAVLYELAVCLHTPELIKNYDNSFNALYFSTITFTTIGYGDYAPRAWLRFFAGLEGLLGMVLISVFTVSFARKLIR